MRTHVLAASAILAAVAFYGARAQTPSTDDFIAGLRPTKHDLTQGAGRGIRRLPVLATEKVQTGPVTKPHTADQTDAAAPSMRITVEFRSGSADLMPEATRTLDHLGRALASDALSAYRFRVEGHTDTVGDPDTNKDLSQRRAQAVAAYLQDKFSIAATRLEVVGMGSSALLVPTPDQTDEPRNRRVRIVNLGT